MSTKTVLVVEDSRSEQRLICGLLKQMGLGVELVENAEAALEWLTSRTPDLMVVDVVMPGISGFDLCRQLRANPSTEKVPIIFCTSKDKEFDKFWGLRQGGNAYLVKPFAPNDLISTVQEQLAAA